jgi:hypothetical protein
MTDNSFNGLINFIESCGGLYKIEAGKEWYVIKLVRKSCYAPAFRIIAGNSTEFKLDEPVTCHTISYAGQDPILEVPLKGTVTGAMFNSVPIGYTIKYCDMQPCSGLCHLEDENFLHVKLSMVTAKELPLYMKNMSPEFGRILKGEKNAF